MRVALLSTLATLSGENDSEKRAFQRLAGRSLLSRQLDLALALGCERVVCVVEGFHPEIAQAQHRAEKAGASFFTVREGRELLRLVRSGDDVLVAGDGILADHATAAGMLAGGKAILVVPAQNAAEAELERIDAEHLWAGLLLMRGSLVEQLADLPGDADPSSALLRIAVQASTPRKVVAQDEFTKGSWLLINDNSKISTRENAWVTRNFQPMPWSSPGAALADRAARLAAPHLFRSDRAPGAAWAAAAITLAIVGLLTVAGFLLAAFLVAVIGALAVEFACAVERIAEAADRGPSDRPSRWAQAFGVVRDALIVGLAAAAMPGEGRWDVTLFAPLVMMAGVLLLERLPVPHWARWPADRTLLASILTVALLSVDFDMFLRVFAAALLGWSLAFLLRVKLTAV